MRRGGYPPIRHKYIKIDPYMRALAHPPMRIGMERGGYPLALGQFLLKFDMRWRARGGYPLFYGQK